MASGPSDLEQALRQTRAACAAAEEEAAYWRGIVEALPEYLSIFDREGRFVYNNRVEGDYQGEEYIGRSLGEIVPEEYWRAAFQNAMAQGCITAYESHDPHRNHWFQCSVGPAALRGQTHLLVISHNIDAQKQAERALADARELWDSLVANSPDVILLLDGEGRVQFINKTAPPYQPEDVVGRYGIDFVEPEYRAAMQDAIRTAAQTGQPQEFEMQDVRAKLWWRVTMVPVRDSRRGDLVLAISQDVTEQQTQQLALRAAHDQLEARIAERTGELHAVNRKLLDDIIERQRVEARLRESEERFRVIAETVPVAIVITRLADGQVVYVNRRTCELMGASRESLVGRLSTEFYADPSEREQLVQRLQQSPYVLDLELWLLTDGQQRRRLVSGNYRPMEFDGESCILTGFVDLTRRIEAEQALLAERRLLQRLLELHERDRQLLSYEIHDGIVQDMTAALMFFESSRPVAAADEPGSEAFQSGVRLLRGSIDEARRVINGLRPPVLEDEGVVAAIVALVHDLERDSGVTIELVHDVAFHRLAPALEMAIYRIVQEGLNNVWHHSRSPRARVELVQRDSMIEIRVQDWGIGFDPAHVAKRRYGLMGMRERARLLNGRTVIRSALGAGTTIQVELPLIDALLPADT